ncbi:DUF4337 domain-containing protein [Limnoglobus roseus]|uniref:DUF4337 domain-containing protein n=1 Tax=Limnoglobus roseus TaxID=2598579 RepID=A0A5C1AJQ6_9BACT|nr:DUF4337 domain-containing protein [Limnoglobus roseus]QEL18417.1 hypothetical protein PX52LOC_05441 [Limnoglobus roseus]
MAEVEIPNPQEVKEKAENPFTRVIALSVAFYAVGLAIASFGGHNAAKEMMLCKQDEVKAESVSRQEAFNVWNQFQSKSTREALYKNERTQLEAEQKGSPAQFPAYKAELLKQYVEDERRMKVDKDELAGKAKTIQTDGEKKVRDIQEKLDRYQRKDPYFDFAEVAFQLAIVLASVAMLSEKRWAFIVSIVLAIVALVLTLNGFLLLFPIPGLDEGAPGA